MQTVPNWQAIAEGYYVVANPRADSIRFGSGKQHFATLQDVHFQREGVVSYYKELLAQYDFFGAAGALKARKMAEAQFGQFLIGIV